LYYSVSVLTVVGKLEPIRNYEKTEAFYLCRFKQMPMPNDEEHLLPPGERTFDGDLEAKSPPTLKEALENLCTSEAETTRS